MRFVVTTLLCFSAVLVACSADEKAPESPGAGAAGISGAGESAPGGAGLAGGGPGGGAAGSGGTGAAGSGGSVGGGGTTGGAAVAGNGGTSGAGAAGKGGTGGTGGFAGIAGTKGGFGGTAGTAGAPVTCQAEVCQADNPGCACGTVPSTGLPNICNAGSKCEPDCVLEGGVVGVACIPCGMSCQKAGGGGTGGAGGCAAAPDCQACCEKLPGYKELLATMVSFCGCDPKAPCYAACKATACAGQPDPSCMTCVVSQAGNACWDATYSACAASPTCDTYDKCNTSC